MVVGFTTIYAISTFEFESRSWQGVLDSTLYYKVCQSVHIVQVNLHLILSQSTYVIAVFIIIFFLQFLS